MFCKHVNFIADPLGQIKMTKTYQYIQGDGKSRPKKKVRNFC